jgi:hypothetical protein
MDLIKVHLLRNKLHANLKSLPYCVNVSKSDVCLMTCKLAYKKNLFPSSELKLPVSFIRKKVVMLFGETIIIYFEGYKNHKFTV